MHDTHKTIGLIKGFQFVRGHPVPDGMAYSFITIENYPSNIEVFHAANISEASDKALHAFKHGKQGAVWLDANDLKFTDDLVESIIARDDSVYNFIAECEFALSSKFPKFLTTNFRREVSSQFDAHFDGTPLALSDHFKAPAVDEFRIVINFDGVPTIVFGRNSVLADKIRSKQKNIPIEEFGHAYICPVGSALFILGGNVGARNSLLHSFPEVRSCGNKILRELAVVECTVK